MFSTKKTTVNLRLGLASYQQKYTTK